MSTTTFIHPDHDGSDRFSKIECDTLTHARTATIDFYYSTHGIDHAVCHIFIRTLEDAEAGLAAFEQAVTFFRQRALLAMDEHKGYLHDAQVEMEAREEGGE